MHAKLLLQVEDREPVEVCSLVAANAVSGGTWTALYVNALVADVHHAIDTALTVEVRGHQAAESAASKAERVDTDEDAREITGERYDSDREGPNDAEGA